MASVVLNRTAASVGRLPDVCVRCGAPAVGIFPTWLERWSTRLLLQLPFCRQHKNHVKRRIWCAQIGIYLGGTLLVVSAWRLDEIKRWIVNPTVHWDVGPTCLVLSVCVLLSMVAIYCYMHARGVHIREVQRDTVVLSGVAPGFGDAFATYRAGEVCSQELGLDSLSQAIIAQPTMGKTAAAGLARDLIECAQRQGPLSEETASVLHEAQMAAFSLSHDHVGTEHLLLALRTLVPTTTAFALKSLGIEPEQIERLTKGMEHGLSLDKGFRPPVTPQLRRAIDAAFAEAQGRQCPVLRATHLLIGLLNIPECTAAQILLQLGHDLHDVRQELAELDVSITTNMGHFGHRDLSLFRRYNEKQGDPKRPPVRDRLQ